MLEVNLPGELDESRGVGRRELAEGTLTEVAVNVLELGVVKGVEAFETKLQTAGFAEGKGLEEREVPVVASRPTQGVVAEIAKGPSRRDASKGRGIDVLDLLWTHDLLLISDFAG